MRTLEKDTPKECIDAFLDAVKAPKAKSDRRIIVVDETLPPQLKKEIDEDLKRAPQALHCLLSPERI